MAVIAGMVGDPSLAVPGRHPPLAGASYDIGERGDATFLGTEPEQDDVLVAFDGYLTGKGADEPATRVAEQYRQHGRDFPRHLQGSFRLALYDTGKSRLQLVSDRAGNLPLYYHETDDHVAFSSHLRVLLAQPGVPRTLDRERLASYLKSWSVSLAAPDTLLEGIDKLPAATIRTVTPSTTREDRYWSMPGTNRDLSLAAAAERLDQRLRSGARELLSHVEEPAACISTGVTGQILRAILSEVSDTSVHTYGWAYDEEELDALQAASSTPDTVFHPVLLDHELPPRDAVWRHEEPCSLLFYLSLQRLREETGREQVFTEQSYTRLFARNLRNVRLLERARPLRPAARLLRHTGLDRLLARHTSMLGNGVDALASPYRSAVITNDHTLRRQDTSRLLQEDLRAMQDPEVELDARHDLHEKRREDVFPYLQFRVREGGYWLPLQWQAVQHLDLLTYRPVVEHVLGLTPGMRRRLVPTLARRYGVSAPADRPCPAGWGENAIRPALEQGWERYAAVIDRFLDRGILSGEARPVLLPDRLSRCSNNRMEYMASIYLLEQWLSTYVERDAPWTPP